MTTKEEANMKRNGAILIMVLVFAALAALAIAAEIQRGTIKDVDVKAGTITFCPEGTTKDMTLKADKSIDLRSVKPETKAEVTVDMNTVKGVKEIKRPKASYGC
jgi:hypothetical protein